MYGQHCRKLLLNHSTQQNTHKSLCYRIKQTTQQHNEKWYSKIASDSCNRNIQFVDFFFKLFVSLNLSRLWQIIPVISKQIAANLIFLAFFFSISFAEPAQFKHPLRQAVKMNPNFYLYPFNFLCLLQSQSHPTPMRGFNVCVSCPLV